LPEAAMTHAGAHAHASPRFQHHFDSLAHQKDAATLGMWVFLVTEIMFFGGMFVAYMIFRMWYFQGFAEASRELDITLGAINTAVLIGSSLTVALAVSAAQEGKQKTIVTMLVLTGILGLVFLVIKYFEYKVKIVGHHFPDGTTITLFPAAGFFDVSQNHHLAPLASQIRIFMFIYFALTGMHAIHMIIGIGVLSVILWMAIRGEFTKEWNTPVEIFGLYWHFVDIVWIFLFPLLYLVERHG
jgi:cytochrome c oxidase subunit III